MDKQTHDFCDRRQALLSSIKKSKLNVHIEVELGGTFGMSASGFEALVSA